MSYTKVSVTLPTDNLPTSAIGQMANEVKVNFLPMGGMKGKNATSFSTETAGESRNAIEQLLAQYRPKLEPYNFLMMEWLQDPAHALSFYNDPLRAFQEAVNPPEDFIAMLKELQANAKKQLPSGGAPDKEVISHICENVAADTLNQIGDLTSGWDLVIGMRQDAVNKGLQYAYDQNLLPHEISGEYESPLKGFDKIIVKAKITPPSMTGGTGSDITAGITVQEGTLEITGKVPVKVKIDKLTMKLTLNLTKVKSPVQPGEGTRYDFMLDIADEEAFVGFSLENVPPALAAFKLLAEMALLELLRSSFAGKQYKIFSADLKGIGDYEFLIPNEIDYAGQSKEGSLPAVGALITTSNGQKGVVQLDHNLFPNPNDNAVMAMSRDLFLKNIGVLGFINAFHVDKSNFSYNTSGHYVYNTKEFNYYEKVKDYTVKIKNAKMKIEAGELVIEIDARVEPSSGIYVDYTVYAPYKASLKEEEGKQAIHFDIDKDRYKESHEVSAEWWVWLIAFLAFIIGTLVLGIILAVIDSVAPTIGVDTFSSAIKDVQWNYLNIVKLKTIDLGDCIRIGCDAKFEKS